MREFFKLDAISYCLLHCVYMQTSRSCQKSMRRQRESKQHGSNLIDQLRIRRGRNDGCLRTVKDGRGKRRGWRKRVRGRRRITYPAGRTDYKKKKKKEGEEGKARRIQAHFSSIVGFSNDFNQGCPISRPLCFERYCAQAWGSLYFHSECTRANWRHWIQEIQESGSKQYHLKRRLCAQK